MHLNEDIYSELEDNNHVGMQSVPHCVSYEHIIHKNYMQWWVRKHGKREVCAVAIIYNSVLSLKVPAKN